MPWVIIAVLSLALVGCFYYHPALTASGLVFVPHDGSADVTATPVQLRQCARLWLWLPMQLPSLPAVLLAPNSRSKVRSPRSSPPWPMTGTGSADQRLDAMMAQLQAMQGNLQAAAQELDQRYGAAQPTVQATDLASLLANAAAESEYAAVDGAD